MPILRLPPALVVALLALFVSLGGVSYGVATGSIDSRELTNNTVRSKDIRNRAIVSKDVKRNSLGGSVVAESKLGKIPVAQNAIHATDASTLGGQGPGAFFPAVRTRRRTGVTSSRPASPSPGMNRSRPAETAAWSSLPGASTSPPRGSSPA